MDQDTGRHRRAARAAAASSGIGVAVAGLLVAWALGPGAPPSPAHAVPNQGPITATAGAAHPATPAADDSRGTPAGSPSSAPSAGPGATTVRPPGPAPSDGRPQPATVTIPAIGVSGLAVQPYLGQTDDRAGTVLQDRGIAASPHGPAGGVGPGGIGNYQVTAHRNTAGGPLLLLPRLVPGDEVEVTTETRRYVYEITQTRRTSFRSPRSLAEQRAAVPGHPGAVPTSAMITVSTCLTQEDHAAGNSWRDEFDNPEHRLDKIGVLVDSTPR